MQANERFSVRFGMVFVLALLLCAPMAMAQSGRISMQGHVTGLIVDGAGYRVTLDNGGYSYWVPAATISDRNIRMGDYVRLDGYGRDGLVTVDNAAAITQDAAACRTKPCALVSASGANQLPVRIA